MNVCLLLYVVPEHSRRSSVCGAECSALICLLLACGVSLCHFLSLISGQWLVSRLLSRRGSVIIELTGKQLLTLGSV